MLGIVTMKDVLKFIFGEISGRMEGQEYYKEDDENSYTVPGDMRLSDFYNLTNFDIEDTVMSTIGGVAFRLFDKLPKVGDKVVHEGYEFTALEVQGLRISRIRVRKLADNPPGQDTAENNGNDNGNGGSDRPAQPQSTTGTAGGEAADCDACQEQDKNAEERHGLGG